MARKSRRQAQEFESAVVENDNLSPEKEKISAAAYARLSVEKETDESIETQIAMLKQYIAEHAAPMQITATRGQTLTVPNLTK